jgi:integrase
VVSAELPQRPDEPRTEAPKRRAVTLTTPPGPSTYAAALAECCALFNAVMAGEWHWPDPEAMPGADDAQRLAPATLQRLMDQLERAVVGEKVAPRTWQRMYSPWLRKLIEKAGERSWPTDQALLVATLKTWEPNSRARQMAHDRIRRLWKQAAWEWPAEVLEMRGNGKAKASPEGVRSFTDEELAELRTRIERSIARHKLTTADLVAWDCLIVFGLRPAELQGLQITTQQGVPIAKVSREKRSSKGASGVRNVPAVPPKDWPADFHSLGKRWKEHGLPPALVAYWSPGEKMAQQLSRLQKQQPVSIPLDAELKPYSCRHAFALRLAQQVGLHVREAAELMGHSPAVHLATYGRRLDSPKLISAVIGKVKANQAQ